MPKSTLFPAIARTRQRIDDLAKAAGRDPQDIRLIAVTKTQEPSALGELAKEAVFTYGENRVDHLMGMLPAAPAGAAFHFIGRIQRRQFAKVIPLCSCLHSFAEQGHLSALVKACRLIRIPLKRRAEYQPIEVFCQVNVGIEEHKAACVLRTLRPCLMPCASTATW